IRLEPSGRPRPSADASRPLRRALRLCVCGSSFALRRRKHDAGDRARELLPAGPLLDEPLAAGRGQSVDTPALIVLRELPVRRARAVTSEPMERRIERPRIDLENILRARSNRLRDAVAMVLTPTERLQDEEIECALEQLDSRERPFLRHGVGTLH